MDEGGLSVGAPHSPSLWGGIWHTGQILADSPDQATGQYLLRQPVSCASGSFVYLGALHHIPSNAPAIIIMLCDCCCKISQIAHCHHMAMWKYDQYLKATELKAFQCWYWHVADIAMCLLGCLLGCLYFSLWIPQTALLDLHNVSLASKRIFAIFANHIRQLQRLRHVHVSA